MFIPNFKRFRRLAAFSVSFFTLLLGTNSCNNAKTVLEDEDLKAYLFYNSIDSDWESSLKEDFFTEQENLNVETFLSQKEEVFLKSPYEAEVDGYSVNPYEEALAQKGPLGPNFPCEYDIISGNSKYLFWKWKLDSTENERFEVFGCSPSRYKEDDETENYTILFKHYKNHKKEWEEFIKRINRAYVSFILTTADEQIQLLKYAKDEGSSSSFVDEYYALYKFKQQESYVLASFQIQKGGNSDMISYSVDIIESGDLFKIHEALGYINLASGILKKLQ